MSIVANLAGIAKGKEQVPPMQRYGYSTLSTLTDTGLRTQRE